MTRRMRRLGPKRARICAESSGEASEVELHAGEAGGFDCRGDFIKRRIDEDADLLELFGEMRHDGRNLCGRDAARAGSKDKAHCIRSRIGGELRVGEGGVAADFDPEAHSLSGSFFEGCAGVGLAHQALADEEGVEAGAAQARDICRS